MVLAIGLSRKTCLPAPAASRVVSRCVALGVVLTIASMVGSSRISSYEGAARQPYFAANFARFSSERVKHASILSLPERCIASASTSDHQPMPTQATRNGLLTGACADGLDRFPRHTRVEFEAPARSEERR